MDDRLRVFVSSRMHELAAERRAVKAALADLEVDAFVYETDAGARPGSIVHTYRNVLLRCDVYLGLFWLGFGDYTRDEYETAIRAGLPCLLYQRPPAAGGEPRDPRLAAFLDEAGHVEAGNVTIAWFDGVDELVGFVARDVDRLRTEAVRTAVRAGNYAYRQGPLGGRLDRAEEPVVKRRTTPTAACVAPPTPFVDREAPRDRIAGAIAQGSRLVGFRGEPGMGKSALLATIAAGAEPPPDGVVCVAAADHTSPTDILLDLWHRYHDVDADYVPDDDRLGRDLRPLQALVTVDDVRGGPDTVEHLARALPEATLVVAGREVDGVDPLAYVKAVSLEGLAEDRHIVELFAAEFGEPVPDDAQDAVVAACRAAGGGPGHIRQLANRAWDGGQPLRAWAAAMAGQEAPVAGAARAAVGGDGVAALRLVAAAGPEVAVPTGVLELLGVDAAKLAALQRAGLIAAASPRFRVDGAVADALGAGDADADLIQATLDWTETAPTDEVAAARAFVEHVAATATAAGRHDVVVRLARRLDGPLSQAGWRGAWRDVLARARAAATAAGDPKAALWATHQLGTATGAVGDADAAVALLQNASELWQLLGDADRAALSQNNLETILGVTATPPSEPPHRAADATVVVTPDEPTPPPKRRRILRWIGGIVAVAVLAAGGILGVQALTGGTPTTTTGSVATTPPLAPGRLDVQPTSIDLGTAPAGGAAATAPLVLTNSGETNLDVGAIDVSGDGFDVDAAPCAGRTLPPADACTVTVLFAPPGVGAFSGAVTVAAGGDDVVVTLQGEGIAGRLTVDPAAVLFGVRPVGDRVDAEVELGNDGSAAVAIGSIELDGPGPFRLDAGACADRDLPPGETCVIMVEFTPRVPGDVATAVVVEADGAPTSIEVSGTGGAAELTLTPTNVAFGRVPATQRTSRDVNVTNSGNVPLVVETIATGSRAFVATPGSCGGATLDAGESCSATVTFAGLPEGAVRGVLAVVASSGTAQVRAEAQLMAEAVVGEGLIEAFFSGATGRFLIGPTPQGVVDYGPLPFGDSVIVELLVTNVGDGPLEVELDPDDPAATQPGAISLDKVDCSGRLASGQSCSFFVELAPLTFGEALAFFEFTFPLGRGPAVDCCLLRVEGV